MANKLYGDTVKDYLVEGANGKGYLKNGKQGFGDGSTSSPVSNYSTSGDKDTNSWFEGKKSDKGFTVKR